MLLRSVDNDATIRYNFHICDIILTNVSWSKIYRYIKQMAECLATYDWRSSDAPGLNENERRLKASFRGSGGYKELRRHVLQHVVKCEAGDLSVAATEVSSTLGY